MVANLLLVDDRPENLLALRAILEPLNCNLICAQSGLEALKHLLKHEFALILLDVQMPGMDGFETASIIKEREKTRAVPIIFVTALSKEQQYMFKGYSVGAVDYISKPFDPDILRSKVEVFVELWRKTQQVHEQGERLHKADLRELERALEQKRLQELAASEANLARFKSTLDATLDSVFIFDAETLRFSYANQGALKHLGVNEEEVTKLTSLEVKPDLTAAEYDIMLAPLRSGQRPTLTFETRHQRSDGTLVPVEVFLQFIARENEANQFISIVRDISERKRAQDLLIAAKEEAEMLRERAETASKAKSEFIAGVSHELRTPLNAICGFSKLLLNPKVGPLNEDQRSYVGDVVESSEHLLQLINDILDLAKIEAGKMTLDGAFFPLSELLENSLGIVREKAALRGVELKAEISPEVAAMPTLWGDGRKVRQILYNLLSNAEKFTPAGCITVGARYDAHIEDVHAPEGEVIVWVSDTGVGIDPQHQEQIFGAFEQADSSYTRSQQGTGLGLTLSKRMVELHGGRLWLESEVGKGSTFYFCLPARFAEKI
jgi:PAS domain S-box-containing protein